MPDDAKQVENAPAMQRAEARGTAWLLDQQADDGGWHSTVYGGLRGGAGVTALVISALQRSVSKSDQRDARIDEAVIRASRFLLAGFKLRRTIASPDGSLDYPTYAAAMIVSSQATFPQLEKSLPRESLVDYLLRAQVTEARGFEESSPDYGGWDYLGPDDARGITTGTNVSITAAVLNALRAEKAPRADESRVLARSWLERCHACTSDGGFAFTPETSSLNNKAQWIDKPRRHPRSYGTAVCDGLAAWLVCGGAANDSLAEKVKAWLVEHREIAFVPGFEDAPPELGWKDGLRFYYYARLTEVLSLLPQAVIAEQTVKIAERLLGEQRPDGSWQNESSRMREDDPLIATSFALLALGSLRGFAMGGPD